MKMNTDHLVRCIQTLDASVARLHQSTPDSIEYEIFRNAIIKSYELVQEIVHKLLRKALLEYGYGARRIDSTPAKDILRLAANHGLMTLAEVERWFNYRDNRNSTAHDYGEGFANETLLLLGSFIADSLTLEAILREKFTDDSDSD
ncbi:MAG: nucleotidyltransferase substrate binding protein [Magnetococcales bacterium]|nr:nucleotidyltransferase substrate binding protein [Magnetococcales bacterium]